VLFLNNQEGSCLSEQHFWCQRVGNSHCLALHCQPGLRKEQREEQSRRVSWRKLGSRLPCGAWYTALGLGMANQALPGGRDAGFKERFVLTWMVSN